MKKQLNFLFLAILAVMALASCKNYETVPNDPMNVRMYTLDNGLKVYMTVNHDEPRIQAYVAVRVGGKNDPAETTGLSHYFEHLMFKGTDKFGTKDYEAEKVLLDQIEELFEAYRNTADPDERTAIYKQIDDISQEASKIAIPNEYDKLMSAIGSEGTNAFTSDDVTAYIESIPSNSLELWAQIQADRFANPVLRLFHTELETVYEEKNMSLTQDAWKVYETMSAALFTHHPYGTQTVIGTQEHLKNPSIINIKKHFDHYYVASNMAVILAGDFDPDKAIKVIEKYFSKLPKGNVEPLNISPEPAITAPVVKEVWGNEAENIAIGFRFPGSASKEAEILQVIDYLLNNGKAGIIDLNINQKQLALSASAGLNAMSDYSIFQLSGRPKAGQTLDEVKDLLLAQIDSLKQGAFPDWLIEATINNFKLREIQYMQYNYIRAYLILDAFVTQQPWKDVVTSLDRQSKITKEDIVAFANEHFGDNYAVVYKREGEDKDIKKIDKPQITPIAANRDDESEYLQLVRETQREPIEPMFIDYDKDITKGTVNNNIPLLYKQNTDNGLFDLIYVFDMGNDNDKALGTAFSYLNYLGTSQLTPEEIKSEFYKIACSYYVNSTAERVYVQITGLDENFEAALTLIEELLSDAQVNQTAFDNLISDINKRRADAKLNQRSIFNMLSQYAMWGPKSSATN
ncbi:MAG: insulinase family protein, partial [Bacteroidales bacterium]|nr:insulinase family protein [Bacteroidales bacterium]